MKLKHCLLILIMTVIAFSAFAVEKPLQQLLTDKFGMYEKAETDIDSYTSYIWNTTLNDFSKGMIEVINNYVGDLPYNKVIGRYYDVKNPAIADIFEWESNTIYVSMIKVFGKFEIDDTKFEVMSLCVIIKNKKGGSNTKNQHTVQERLRP